ncbi:LytTR family DNA-binding domain-containing protein [Sphingobacterium sp. SRCM116780]|uniref:LytR/AlgR family response regulator transcription factor n=1 Tax=Sphingobacterium sp. SRCM116780 TaxID=2907623 RepID=UPI001F1C2EE1|nr:LytTR family DNA-binding domain-containing protein [Sphingobacterium sp. SRCM116780]UIR55634.1 LytTR family DNA-binding domain-containing protein [Sphingobacterium sp. SRCM116780]
MLKAVILDDEVKGSKLLSQKLGFFEEELQVVGIFNQPTKALNALIELKPDVLFLDIEMPGMNGFQFLERLGSFDFEVIFTTAYDSYTLEALRLSAVDYLLKPIDEEELRTAITRLRKRVAEKSNYKSLKKEKVNSNRLALATAEGVYIVDRANIMRVEAMSNYSVFILAGNKKIVVSKTLKEFENILDDEFFTRISRSVIINLTYVVKYRKGDGGTLELSDGSEVEVSAYRKDVLLQKLF